MVFKTFSIASLLCTGLVISLSTLTSASKLHIDTSTGRIRDNLGRERQFHGWNVVYKTAPFLPNLIHFDPVNSFTGEDAALLQSLGTNSIRLNVAWAGLFPTKTGGVDATYLANIQSIISLCDQYGISVLIDFHQDSLAERFCGNGVPSWIANQMPTQQFPGPLGGTYLEGCGLFHLDTCYKNLILKQIVAANNATATVAPYTFDSTTSLPSPISQCNNYYFAEQYFSYGVSSGFQALYNNTNGIADQFVNYWVTMAKAFKDSPNIVGYELINEPWVAILGCINPIDLLTKGTGALYSAFSQLTGKNLVPFYEKVISAIRAVDKETLILFESDTFDNKLPIPFSTVPGGNASNTVFAYHYYDTVANMTYSDFLPYRLADAKRLNNIGTFMTETNWEIGIRGTVIDPTLITKLDVAEQNLQSYTLWNYKLYDDRTGPSFGLFTSDGTLNTDLATITARSYAPIVAGTTITSQFDSKTKFYNLKYTFDPKVASGSTQIFLNQNLVYVKGFNVSTVPVAGVTTAYNATSSLLQVDVDAGVVAAGTVVNVQVVAL
ncbi:hypothetical protein HDU76_012526 [Blyttiomyces sp. JEL0837]|nr:hypothetical protein HDU76_012526 [Blyttiomyces sp. JEL0837]